MFNVYDVVVDYCLKNRNDVFQKYVEEERQWTQATLDKWKLGFFPANDILSLKVITRNNGGSEDDLEDAYIINKKRNWSIFSDRLIFPVFDVWHKAIAITGRTLQDDVKPKYFNTFYEKGKNLYGLNFAIEEIIKQKRAYVFEGNADVVMSHQYGITNSLCCMGTTFSEDHFNLLSRYAKDIVLIFDNDAGGQGALGRFNEKGIDRGKTETNVYRCTLKDEQLNDFLDAEGEKIKDADEFLKSFGGEKFLDMINATISNRALQERYRAIKPKKSKK